MDEQPKSSATELKELVERIERLLDEAAELRSDANDLFKEADEKGFDVKVIRKILSRRKRDRSEVEHEDEILALYETHLKS